MEPDIYELKEIHNCVPTLSDLPDYTVDIAATKIIPSKPGWASYNEILHSIVKSDKYWKSEI